MSAISSDSTKSSSFGLSSTEKPRIRGAIALSSFFFVLLQSVCTFFIALSGVRLLIGVGSLAAAAEAGGFWDRFHTDSIRIPMMALALGGALVSLFGLLRVWRLRRRPATRWRQKPLTARTVVAERVEFALAIITLVLFCMEELSHIRVNHHL